MIRPRKEEPTLPKCLPRYLTEFSRGESAILFWISPPATYTDTKELQSLANLSPKEAVELLELEPSKLEQVVSLLTELHKVFETT